MSVLTYLELLAFSHELKFTLNVLNPLLNLKLYQQAKEPSYCKPRKFITTL